jgi:microcystin-dependent protein
MSDPFVAEIRMFGGGLAPNGWARCNGQLMPISQNAALFSRLGTSYGGDGTTTFALPNLQSTPPIGAGATFFIAMRGIFPSRG